MQSNLRNFLAFGLVLDCLTDSENRILVKIWRGSKGSKVAELTNVGATINYGLLRWLWVFIQGISFWPCVCEREKELREWELKKKTNKRERKTASVCGCERRGEDKQKREKEKEKERESEKVLKMNWHVFDD